MMFCTPDSGSFSKADILRGIITEKLSIATRDILAVVERTVADYEEEASGFRRRIARQERQLELLQPRVHLRTCCEEPEPEPLKEELLSPPPGIEDSGRSDLPQENHEDDDDDDVGGFDDEVNDEEEDEVQPSAASRKRSRDPDFEIKSRSMPHKPPQYTARLSRVQNSPTHLDLKIRFMMDPNVTVFRPFYLKNTLVRDFSFPRDLPESEFVDLLRSSFPPLAGSHKAFDIYTVNRSKKLQKLPLRTMTPNEIIRSIKANAPQAAVLFIKLQNPEAEKKPEETSADKLKGTSEENLEENVKDNVEENTEEENTEEERLEEDPEDVSAVEDKPSSCDAEEDEAGPSSSSSPLGFRKKAEFRDSPEHHEDSEMDDVDQDDVSAEDPERKLESQQQEVVKKAADKSQEKREKPRKGGADNPDQKSGRMMFWTPDSGSFSKADILRGSYHREAQHRHPATSWRGWRTVADYEEEASGFRRRIARQERQLELLQPREVEEPEPRGSEELDGTEPPKEELLSPPPGTEDSVRFNFPQDDDDDDDGGGCGGFDDEANDEEEQVQQVQSSAGSTESSTVPVFEIPSRSTSRRPPRHTARPGRVLTNGSPTHLNLRVRFMMDPNVTVFRSAYLKNTLVRDFSFPRDLPESELVDLLRSSFPPLASSHKAFDIYTINRSKKLQKLPLKTMTPNEIIRSVKANAPQATVLFIKLKKPEAEKKSEDTSEEKEKCEENTVENMEDVEEEHLEKNTEQNAEKNIEEEHLEENTVEKNIEEEHLEENTVEKNIEEEHLEENTVEKNIEEEHLEENTVEKNIEERI
ncbi:hypothetical protein OJAV_G00185320 [Oryzias javanicus]|uniref:Uncharacterized protein n=1 Tax=Oryzias javanicus TaxID=123683 RepID=A0A437CDI7_ORYJA|nr:hypothetical protein OJAV_G00185320 [Oryzias javanicus]